MNARRAAFGITAVAALLEVFASYHFRLAGRSGATLDLDWLAAVAPDPLLWIAVCAFVAAPFLFLLALRWGELSLAAPLLAGFNLLFSHGVGLIALGEVPTPRQWLGQAFLLVAFIAFYGGRRHGSASTL